MSAIIIAVISSSFVLPALAFILFGSAAWLLMDLVSSRASTAEQRLDEFKDPSLRKRKERGEGSGRGGLSAANLSRVLKKASPALSKPLQPKNENEVGKLKLRLTQAGFRSEAAPALFLSLKFAMLIGGLFLGGGGVMLIQHLNGLPVFGYATLIKSIFFAGGLFYLPELALWWITSRRKNRSFSACLMPSTCS